MKCLWWWAWKREKFFFNEMKRIFDSKIKEKEKKKSIDWYRSSLVWLVSRKNPDGGEGGGGVVGYACNNLTIGSRWCAQREFIYSSKAESTYKTSWLFFNIGAGVEGGYRLFVSIDQTRIITYEASSIKTGQNRKKSRKRFSHFCHLPGS
jgi:hypothetical protein